ncbi:hypothetical protein EV385_0797 [Krasilnikovia cinnamomea]|uniref:Uncharacterized protein n=1 Tax=Krasilnikovia cinnamomea TaxID=349313 RepID=A0A4Q7ZEB1_9ACTN|nr:hypothetical protein [Krasilnikovia cinnamomea]RZU49062.1 hypothetical protein EV385_0797 [Krasilnikovia cinnamomea]
MAMTAEQLIDATCVVCPAQSLPLGQFDVTDRPGPTSRYDPELGCRVDVHTRVPVCVHPYRVGLPPGAYRSGGLPVPTIPEEPPAPTRDALELPDDVTNLEAWIIAVVRAAGPARIHQALAAAETLAGDRFAERDVVIAMRRVLTVELARR